MNRDLVLQVTGQQDPARVYKLQLTNKSIRLIDGLRQFTKLRCLVLSYNLIDNIENINHLADLRQLHLQNNEINRMGGMDANKNMQVINLSNNRIEKIQGIAHMIRLQTLNLNNNCIHKLTGLDYLKQLKTLSVSHNQLSSIQNLPAFSKLSTLNLNHNNIANIPSGLFMSCAKSLLNLSISHNRLTDSAFLMNLVSLQTLALSHNSIKELQVPIMSNLQSLDVSHNQIQKLPLMAPCFPEIITLDVSHNFICSQYQILSALQEVVYLTEFDFRENPMWSISFQEGLQKVHSFDFLNGKVMSQAGAKYYKQVQKIQEDLHRNSDWYGQDDQKDREIKMSGFFNQDLQFKMSGMEVNRPKSPVKKKKIEEKTIFYEGLDRTYHDFMENDSRIKVLRDHYLKICGKYQIASSPHVLTEVPQIERKQESKNQKERKEESMSKQGKRLSVIPQLQNNVAEMKKQNEKNLNKWKQLKQRQKSFNIRQVLKKPRGRQSSSGRFNGTGSGMSGQGQQFTSMNSVQTIQQSSRQDLFRTQLVGRKGGQQLIRTMKRPLSMKRKQ